MRRFTVVMNGGSVHVVEADDIQAEYSMIMFMRRSDTRDPEVMHLFMQENVAYVQEIDEP